MPDALTMAQLLIEHPAEAPLTMAAFFALSGIVMSTYLWRVKQLGRMSNPRNCIRVLLTFALATCSCALFYFLQSTSNLPWFALLAVLWAAFAATGLDSLRELRLQEPRNTWLKKKVAHLRDGTYDAQAQYFEGKRPWYLWTRREQIEFALAQCQYHICMGQCSEALACLQSIPDSRLYPEEIELITLQKAVLLLEMGNMVGARETLDSLNDAFERPMKWSAYSHIADQSGNFDMAMEYAAKAKGLADAAGDDDAETAQVYMNYGCRVIANGNREEGLDWMQLAWERSQKLQDNRHLLAAGRNRVVQMAQCGVNSELCHAAYGEIATAIAQPESASNQIALVNTKLAYLQLLGDERAVYETLRDSYGRLSAKMDGIAFVRFTASTFKSALSRRFRHEWLDEGAARAASLLEELNADTLARLEVFRVFDEAVEPLELAYVRKLDPYRQIYAAIESYLSTEARSDIARLLAQRDPADIYRYKQLKLYEIWITRHSGGDSFRRVQKLYDELAKTLGDAGLDLDRIQVGLQFAKECAAPDTVLFEFEGEMRPLSEIATLLGPPPVPEVDRDGVHLRCLTPQPNGNVRFAPLREREMREALSGFVDDARKWKHDPAIAPFVIEAAQLYMRLGDYGSAFECLGVLDECGIAEHQLPIVVRRELALVAFDLANAMNCSGCSS